jgi:hypothetical protein
MTDQRAPTEAFIDAAQDAVRAGIDAGARVAREVVDAGTDTARTLRRSLKNAVSTTLGDADGEVSDPNRSRSPGGSP